MVKLKRESSHQKRWFVLDLNTTEECKSLKEAMDKADYWIDLQRDIVKDFEDDEILHQLRSTYTGLDAGDVELYEVEEEDWEDIQDYDGRISGIKIRELLDPIRVYSGKAVLEEIAEERGLI